MHDLAVLEHVSRGGALNFFFNFWDGRKGDEKNYVKIFLTCDKISRSGIDAQVQKICWKRVNIQEGGRGAQFCINGLDTTLSSKTLSSEALSLIENYLYIKPIKFRIPATISYVGALDLYR